jgi:hypothetical protein
VPTQHAGGCNVQTAAPMLQSLSETLCVVGFVVFSLRTDSMRQALRDCMGCEHVFANKVRSSSRPVCGVEAFFHSFINVSGRPPFLTLVHT